MNSRSEIKLVLAMVVFLVAGNQLQAGVDESTSEEAHRIDLRQAISIALQKSLVLKEANLDLEIARGQVREAWSNVLPSVTASASYSRSIIPQSIFLPA
ncbi:MAG: TolC family protein, partial [Candidatus Marinimicrobia bacterium]|nr:TolC family protein [Candidatus Neomarinimicrobiota bacterium]